MKESTFSIKKSKAILWAFLVWTLWMVFYAVVMNWQIPEINFLISLFSSANYNYIFAVLSIFIWTICRKLPFDKIPISLLIAIHFLLAIVFSLTWLAIVYGLWVWWQGKEVLELMEVRSYFGWQVLFGMMTYFFVVGIFYTIIYYRTYKQKQLDEAELKILTRDAELKALKLQMNPHFLFNSLNAINALVTSDPALARKMMSRLSELLRCSLQSKDKLLIPLREELNIVHKYLDIEQVRFQDRMVYHEEIDPALLPRSFPAMLLQPLVENAVRHGIANNRDGGTIELRIKEQHERLVLTVENSSASPLVKKTSANGTGLPNIRRRLDILYGQNYSWTIDDSDPLRYRVTIELPIEAE